MPEIHFHVVLHLMVGCRVNSERAFFPPRLDPDRVYYLVMVSAVGPVPLAAEKLILGAIFHRVAGELQTLWDNPLLL